VNALSDDEVHRLLDAVLGPRDASRRATTLGAGGYDLEAGRRYLAAVAGTGLAVPTWPVEFGGLGADAAEARRLEALHHRYAMPDMYPFRVGLKFVGPTLLAHGTPEQQQRWLAAIASGKEIWCQMFSEPEAGSDLANVATIARRGPAGDWILTGQKVWTSRAAYADWGICLARTDPDVPKHRGMTMFAVDMSAPGVDVRPLRQMNGDASFSEVFLTDVPVPDENRIGEVGQGWKVALTLLAHERSNADRSAPPARDAPLLPSWLTELADSGALADPVLREEAMELFCYDRAIHHLQQRAAELRAAGKPGPEGSGLKVHGARSFKRRVDLLARARGAEALRSDWPGCVDLLTAPSMSIRGGTDEIQLNVIGERILGLPAEPRVDRDVPWTVARRGAITPSR
jgi:Acyl-CoA dehydrogenases